MGKKGAYHHSHTHFNKKGTHHHFHTHFNKRPPAIVGYFKRRTEVLGFVAKILGLCLLVLGAHGLYSYFYAVEALFDPDWDKLFLSLSVPGPLADVVEWMTKKSILSWFMAVVFGAVGVLALMYGETWTRKIGSWWVKRWKFYGVVAVGVVVILFVSGSLSASTSSGGLAGSDNESLPTKRIGPWQYTLLKAGRSGNTETVQVSITNMDSRPLEWDSGSVGISYPGFLCLDQYGEVFTPEDDTWYWMQTLYPGEKIKGKLKYRLHPESKEPKLYLGMNSMLIQPRTFLFNLE